MIRIPFVATTLLFAAACAPSGGDKTSESETSDETSCVAGACDEDGDGFKPSEGDCDDADSTVNPGQTELCDGLDNNCDGAVDEGVTGTYYMDYDADGFGASTDGMQACEQPVGYVTNANDCNDSEPRSYPGNPEVCDEIDNNCDTQIDEEVANQYFSDADADAYGDPASAMWACERPSGYVTDSTDCDDTTAKSFPGNAEVCDEIDNDCNGSVDEGVTTTYWADVDGDTHGDLALSQEACAVPTGYTDNPNDCNDTLASVFPGSIEYCNTIDDDCDAVVDEDDAADAIAWYADTDTDTYGDPAVTYKACTAPAGYVADNTDCDDTRATSNPAAAEYCNTYDDDCDEVVDEDDAVDAVTWYLDADADTFGNPAVSDVSCYVPSGYVGSNTDCDDGDATSFPGGIEVCDGADNDCNSLVDDDPTDGTTYYADKDGDGFGDPADTDSECAVPSGYVENAYDCDDYDGLEPVVADVYNGSPSGYGTLARPFDSMQDAIDQSYSCVVVYSGTYNEQIDLGGKSIDVWGVEGSDVTQIDAALSTCTYANPRDCGAAVTIASGTGAAPTLRGFSISGGSGHVSESTSDTTCADSSASHAGGNTCTVTTYEYCGGGIYISGDDPILDDVAVETNTLPDFGQFSVGSFEQYWLYSSGGGICALDANVQLTNVTVTDNYADQGGGIFVGSGSLLEIDASEISENDASDGGGMALDNGSATATNVILACNDASTDGGGIFTETAGSTNFVNVSFYGNTSDTSGTARGSDAWIGASTTFSLYNSIVENDIATNLLYAAGTGTSAYNNVYNDERTGGTYSGGISAGTGDIAVGGNFVRARCDGNPNNDDWTLDSYSSSIDAGDSDAAYNDVDGSRNDQGAYGGPGGSW